MLIISPILPCSFSFYMNPNWSRSFAGQEEILKYMEDMSDHFGITERIEFGKRMTTAHWDNERQKWQITLSDGEVGIHLVSSNLH